MLCVILFGLLTIDVMSFHWFRTFSLWGVKKYYRKSHSFSWLENISKHHWLSLSCSPPCALAALVYAWYWHFNCSFVHSFLLQIIATPLQSSLPGLLFCCICVAVFLFYLFLFSAGYHTPSVAIKKPIWSQISCGKFAGIWFQNMTLFVW